MFFYYYMSTQVKYAQIKHKVQIRQEQVATICKELLKGLEYLHSEGMIMAFYVLLILNIFFGNPL